MNVPRFEIEKLERRGWDSLCDGTGDRFYGEVMTDDSLMVLANGARMTRDQVVSALTDAPPWDGYEMRDVRMLHLTPTSAALAYTGIGHREGQDDFVGIMTSVYVEDGGRWKLALYTQTPVVGS